MSKAKAELSSQDHGYTWEKSNSPPHSMSCLKNGDVLSYRVELLKRWISAEALYKLQSITYGVFRMMHGLGLPYCGGPSVSCSMLGDVVFFAGGNGAGFIARASINRFLRSQCCSYMAIVSEVQPSSVLESPIMSNVCVVAKYGRLSELCFIHADSSMPNYKVIKRVENVEALYHEIEVLFGNGLTFPYNTRNVVINNDIKCIK